MKGRVLTVLKNDWRPFVFVVGASGAAAQVVLLRELWVSFFGNELSIGVIFAGWMLNEAVGAWLFGKVSDRLRRPWVLIVALQTVFLLGFIFSLFACRAFKSWAGIPFGSGAGIATALWASLAMLFPAAFFHGALFSSTCRLYATEAVERSTVISRVYRWETCGTIAGAALTALASGLLGSFELAFVVAWLNLFLTAALIIAFAPGRNRFVPIGILVVLAAALAVFPAKTLERLSLSRRFPDGEVLAHRNSVYGNIAVVRSKAQTTFFYNGLPALTIPHPHEASLEDYVHLSLLSHPSPERVLVIGQGMGGLIAEVLKHPVRSVDYLELDRLLISLYMRYALPASASELTDPRVSIIHKDARDFLSKNKQPYDVILIASHMPQDLVTARLFSREFFSLCLRNMRREGIVALSLPGSFSFFSPQLVNLNLSVYDALAAEFPYSRVVVGDNNLFFAGVDPSVEAIDQQLLSRRISERRIEVKLLVPGYLALRMDQERVAWFMQSASGKRPLVNLDARPAALFYALVYGTRQFNPALGGVLEKAAGIRPRHIFLAVCALLMTGLAVCRMRKEHCPSAVLIYATATTGFFGMLANLLLLYGFQVRFGYIYKGIGFLIALFMAGIASGSFFIEKRLSASCRPRTLLFAAEASMAGLAVLLALFFREGVPYSAPGAVLFACAFFSVGFSLGAEFPVVNHLYLKSAGIGSAAGTLYGWDLAGGCCAGLFGAVILVPITGLVGCAAALFTLKLSSLAFMSVCARKIQRL